MLVLAECQIHIHFVGTNGNGLLHLQNPLSLKKIIRWKERANPKFSKYKKPIGRGLKLLPQVCGHKIQMHVNAKQRPRTNPKDVPLVPKIHFLSFKMPLNSSVFHLRKGNLLL